MAEPGGNFRPWEPGQPFDIPESYSNIKQDYLGATLLTPEVLFIDDYTPWMMDVDRGAYEPPEDLIEIIKNDPIPHIIVALGIDECCVPVILEDAATFWSKRLGELHNQGVIEQYSVILNDNAGPATVDRLPRDSNVMRCHWWMLSTFLCYPAHERYIWNPRNNKLLYLPGKMEKFHRIYPLWFLDQNNSMSDVVYTYTGHAMEGHTQTEWDHILCKTLNTAGVDITVTDFSSWSKKMEMCRDQTIVLSKNAKSFLNIPVSPHMYSEVSMELISETWIQLPFHLTEKTFRAIITGFPFIHIGLHFGDHLKSLGFSDFLKFTDITEQEWRDQVEISYEAHSYETKVSAKNDAKYVELSVCAAYQLKEKMNNSPQIRKEVYLTAMHNKKLMIDKCEKLIQHISNKHPINIHKLFNLDWQGYSPRT